MKEEKINITFHGKRVPKSFYSECILSPKYNNIILCESKKETSNITYNIYSYIKANETKLILIQTVYGFNFPLFCNEAPPIVALIVFLSVFFFVVIVVIAILTFLNRL